MGLHHALIPFAELPANATRYVLRLGTPEPALVQIMTIGWGVCSWIAAMASFVLLLAVLSSERARASAFNLFLAGLTVPDLMLNMSTWITMTANLIHPAAVFHGSVGVARCSWQGGMPAAPRLRAPHAVTAPLSARLCSVQAQPQPARPASISASPPTHPPFAAALRWRLDTYAPALPRRFLPHVRRVRLLLAQRSGGA
jgi:hypothetical protein